MRAAAAMFVLVASLLAGCAQTPRPQMARTEVHDPLRAPVVDAGPDQVLGPGVTARLEATVTNAVGATITWKQVGGPSVQLHQIDSRTVRLTPDPFLSDAGADLVFQVDVSTGKGNATDRVHVYLVPTPGAGYPIAGEGATQPPASPDDADQDGVRGASDNCPGVGNPTQSDLDQDGVGDACDFDVDGDGVPDKAPGNRTARLDNCPTTPNAQQESALGAGPGDACRPVDGWWRAAWTHAIHAEEPTGDLRWVNATIRLDVTGLFHADIDSRLEMLRNATWPQEAEYVMDATMGNVSVKGVAYTGIVHVRVSCQQEHQSVTTRGVGVASGGAVADLDVLQPNYSDLSESGALCQVSLGEPTGVQPQHMREMAFDVDQAPALAALLWTPVAWRTAFTLPPSTISPGPNGTAQASASFEGSVESADFAFAAGAVNSVRLWGSQAPRAGCAPDADLVRQWLCAGVTYDASVTFSYGSRHVRV